MEHGGVSVDSAVLVLVSVVGLIIPLIENNPFRARYHRGYTEEVCSFLNEAGFIEEVLVKCLILFFLSSIGYIL